MCAGRELPSRLTGGAEAGRRARHIRCRVANARHHRICARRGQAPTNMIQTVVDAVLAGDRRIAGRLLSRAEAADPTITRDLQRLYRAGGKARMIGITGPPGTGKSTMVDQMVALYRAQDKRVAILAFDPSSPFSGGAVLGDQGRMLRHRSVEHTSELQSLRR